MPIDFNRSQILGVLGAAEAQAQVNIALIKYWGKSEVSANTPAVGSLSLTLDGWGSKTTLMWVRGDDSTTQTTHTKDASHLVTSHLVTINQVTGRDQKVERLLNLALELAERRGHSWAKCGDTFAIVQSENTVPTASGLASSASGMAALGVAAWVALGYGEDLTRLQSGIIDSLNIDLINLVRVGSGSAIRSLFGGLVRLEQDGVSLKPLCASEDWKLAIVVAVVDPGPKAVSSRAGMERTRATSPYYPAWVSSHATDLEAAEYAIAQRDLDTLGALMERSTFKMHASMWAADPPLRYLKGASFDVLDVVEGLRSQGISAWATMDAGPHVKVLCTQQDANQVAQALREIKRLDDVVIRYPGSAVQAQVIDF